MQVGGGQFVTAEELTTEQVDCLTTEETRSNLWAKLGLHALQVVLGALASKPGDCLVGIDLGDEVSAKGEINISWEQAVVR